MFFKVRKLGVDDSNSGGYYYGGNREDDETLVSTIFDYVSCYAFKLIVDVAYSLKLLNHSNLLNILVFIYITSICIFFLVC